MLSEMNVFVRGEIRLVMRFMVLPTGRETKEYRGEGETSLHATPNIRRRYERHSAMKGGTVSLKDASCICLSKCREQKRLRLTNNVIKPASCPSDVSQISEDV
jgi:hypothetical protein